MDMNRMHQAVKELINLRDEKKRLDNLRIKYFKIYNKYLGQVQEMGRKITKKLDELDEFR